MLVDVILTLYNGERWIDEAVRSVVQQTYDHWQLTVVDDASPDRSAEKVLEWQANHPDRIRLIRLDRNRRAAGARMEAIRKTNGQAIAFLDQDDRWHPEKLQRQVERLGREPAVDGVHTDVVHIDEAGGPIHKSANRENARRASIPYDQLAPAELSRLLFQSNTIRLVSAVVTRRAFLDMGGFNEELFGGEDWDFWVRFASRFRIAHLNVPLVERRQHTMNVSRCYRGERTVGLLRALETVVRNQPHFAASAARRKSSVLKQTALAALAAHRPDEARRHARAVLQLAPHDVAARCLWMLSYSGTAGARTLRTLSKLANWGI